MIEVKNVEKSFGDSKVLKGISTIFETGKTNLIIGQSGSYGHFFQSLGPGIDGALT